MPINRRHFVTSLIRSFALLSAVLVHSLPLSASAQGKVNPPGENLPSSLKLESTLGQEQAPAPHVALILPLTASGLNKLADAVKLGFAAAQEFEGKAGVPYRVYSVNNEGDAMLAAARAAISQGAVFIVAGMTRDGANKLSSDSLETGSLALNQPTQTRQLPDEFHYLSLSADHEARLAALQAYGDGLRTPLVVATSTPLSQRVAEAFEQEWQRITGESAKRVTYSGKDSDAISIRSKSEGHKPDFLFYAAGAKEARTARPYTPPTTSAYGTSQLFESRSDSISNLDLSGTKFPEMPWLVQADHPAVAIYSRPKAAFSLEQERLYALGIDAYRLAAMLIKPRNLRDKILDGVTGKLELESTHGFVRTPMWVEYQGGKILSRGY